MNLKISEIKIGQRVRDEFGDMESLAESIKEHGLLHPIVVDSGHNLIAGCRRLLACERLGRTEIEVKMLSAVSEKELRILELEENIRRKDLTELEKSKNLVELAEIKEQELREKLSTESVGKYKREAHRPINPVSVQNISKELGTPVQTLKDAKQHVKAVEEFPPLEGLPKYQAIETAKELRQAPPEEQEKILDFASRKSELPSVQKDQDFYSYLNECGKVTKKYHKAICTFLDLNADEKDFKMLSEVITPQTATTYLHEAEDTISKLSRIRDFMKGVIRNGENKNVRDQSAGDDFT